MTGKLPHILLPEILEVKKYANPRIGSSDFKIKTQNRIMHGTTIKNKLINSWDLISTQTKDIDSPRKGFYLEFVGEQGFDISFESLESRRSKNIEKQVRILNTRVIEKADKTKEEFATIYIPVEKKEYLLKKINQYIVENTKKGNPKNQRFINNIQDIRSGMQVISFWQDPISQLPRDSLEWCEIWLSNENNETKEHFNKILKKIGIQHLEGYIDFPERSIKMVYANEKILQELIVHSDDIAEIRRAKETAAFWANSQNFEQSEWVSELVARTKIKPEINTSVCILDTGINNGHPLLESLLAITDCQSYDSSWGISDDRGHGTNMAGLSAYGDLISCLMDSDSLNITHVLESVKILPPSQDQRNPEYLWGFITSQAISLAEIQAPKRNRVICMAITAEDNIDRGRPSSWSGSIDQITSGVNEEKKPKRLFIVSGGNISNLESVKRYPQELCLDSIHDPAQAWNAITVGGYTDLCSFTDNAYDGFQPIAPPGGISPFSTTSSLWREDWPIKPDVLMEAGNVAINESGFVECNSPDLSLLTTYYQPQSSHFCSFNMTSAATAQMAWFAAKILAQYPIFWPETIRGLIIHSAEWTDTQKRQFLGNNNKTDRRKMLRICGYGVPNFEKALYSASNYSTMIAQSELQPYKKEKGTITTSDMHLYDLPWPSSVLENLPPQTEISMRVTLSYFIEPGPGEVGWKNRYKYQSHSLKFFLKNPTETKDTFIKRINLIARADEEEQTYISEARYWYFGEQARNRGSIHSDIWNGTPQELANSNIIAVVPGGGWWKNRAYLGKWENKARYSLIVSIQTNATEVDIYTPIITKVKIPIQIPT